MRESLNRGTILILITGIKSQPKLLIKNSIVLTLTTKYRAGIIQQSAIIPIREHKTN